MNPIEEVYAWAKVTYGVECNKAELYELFKMMWLPGLLHSDTLEGVSTKFVEDMKPLLQKEYERQEKELKKWGIE